MANSAASLDPKADRRLGPAFANVFTSNLASSLGEGVARTAAPLLAVQLTHDPLLISGVAALSLLPWLFFAIPAGVLVDRIDRRLALALANGVRGLLAATLTILVATGTLTIWSLYLVIFIYGACETVYDGAIRAVIPSIVKKAGLPAANSRIEAGELVVQNFLAAPITSVLFAVSVLIPLGVNVAVCVLALVLAFLLPRAASGRQFRQRAAVDASAVDAPSNGGPQARWYSQFADGFRFIIANPMLRTLWFFSTFIGLAFSAATAGFVLYLVKHLGLPEALYGIFLLTGAVGGILGSILASRLKNRLGAGQTMALANMVSCLALIFVGMVPTIWAAAIGFFLESAAVTIWNILIMSLRQSAIPGRMLGRVHGTWRTLLWGTMPIGSLIGGLLGRVDLALPFIASGIVATFASILFYRFVTRLPNPEDVDNGDRDGVDKDSGEGPESESRPGMLGVPLED